MARRLTRSGDAQVPGERNRVNARSPVLAVHISRAYPNCNRRRLLSRYERVAQPPAPGYFRFRCSQNSLVRSSPAVNLNGKAGIRGSETSGSGHGLTL